MCSYVTIEKLQVQSSSSKDLLSFPFALAPSFEAAPIGHQFVEVVIVTGG